MGLLVNSPVIPSSNFSHDLYVSCNIISLSSILSTYLGSTASRYTIGSCCAVTLSCIVLPLISPSRTGSQDFLRSDPS